MATCLIGFFAVGLVAVARHLGLVVVVDRPPQNDLPILFVDAEVVRGVVVANDFVSHRVEVML